MSLHQHAVLIATCGLWHMCNPFSSRGSHVHTTKMLYKLKRKTLLRFWSVGVGKAGNEAGEDLCKGAAVSEAL